MSGKDEPASKRFESLSISIGICAHNEEENIGRLLSNLTDRDVNGVPLPEAIIVATSGCTDRTEEIVREWKRSNSKILLLSEAKREGKAKAINSILEHCASDILVFISADSLPAKDTVGSLVRWFIHPKVGGVSGKPIPVNRRRGFGCLGHIMWALHSTYQEQLTREKKPTHLSGEMCAVRRRLVPRIPPEIINDDAYLTILIKNRLKHCRTMIDPEAIVYMKAPENIYDLIQQRRRVLTGHGQVKMRTGENPLVLETTWRRNPKEAVKTMLTILKDFRLEDCLWLLVLLLSELTAFILSRMERPRDRAVLWPRIDSTKALLLENDATIGGAAPG